MNWFPMHLGDWSKKCSHLSMAEEGCYLRLVRWYYAHEQPLPGDLRDVRRIAGAKSHGEQGAVERVLGEFFAQADDGRWHQGRCDKQLAAAERSKSSSDRKRVLSSDRKERYRERRRTMYEELRRKGVIPEWNEPTQGLEKLCARHGVTHPDCLKMRQVERVPGTAASLEAKTPYRRAVPGLVETLTGEARASGDGEEAVPCVPGAFAPGPARASPDEIEACCRAMEKAGFPGVRPNDPRLHTLIEQGATAGELGAIGAEAAARGKSWAWLLATCAGRRTDAAGTRLGGRGSFEADWFAALTQGSPSDAPGDEPLGSTP